MSTPGDESTGVIVTERAGKEVVQRVSYLERTLWDKLSAAKSAPELAEFWLLLQCRMIDRAARAAIFLRSEETGHLVPAAFWPESAGDGPTSLLTTAKRAISEGKGVVAGHQRAASAGVQLCCAAYPFVLDGESCGAVAIELADRNEEELRAVMHQLQWGGAWIELALHRQRQHEAGNTVSKSAAALDLIALLVEQDSYREAGKAMVTELATRLGCDFVALGSTSGRHYKIVALSHSAQFDRRMNLLRTMAAAMEEASDQGSVVLFPVPDGSEYRVTLAHEELSGLLDEASVLTVPLLSGGRPVGALVFQWPVGTELDQGRVDLCDAVAAVAGPVLEEKRRNDRIVLFKLWDALIGQLQRLFGPHFLGRKLALGAIALLVVFFSVAEDIQRISTPATIEGSVQRVIVAPFDGYIATQFVRAGDTVSKDMVLATLDSRDLTLELLRWTTTRQQRIAEYDQAIAKHDRAGTQIVEAQVQQADAHIALFEEQLKRTELLSAFEGIVVSGDLSQSIGAAVKRGDELFRIAPLDSYRVILQVDETRVSQIAAGQTGQLKVASLLDETLPYTVERITSITESRDGHNFFRIEAVLNESNGGLRPGMEGIAKTATSSRLLIRIWTEEFYNWLRLKLWEFWP
jgi:hypothetical protein